jgi:hypothetical protein
MAVIQQVLASLKGGLGPPGSIQVTGAGTAAANGTYTLTGTSNGKNYYNKSGTTTFVSSVWWDGGAWGIYNSIGQDLYYSSGADDVATPDLVPTWGLGSAPGSNPVPTVTMN